MSCAVRTLPRPRLLALAVTAIASTAVPLVSADLRPDYRPAAYAIRGATIVAGPATTHADGTVVVRDGVIEAVGPSARVAVPFDAEVIEGKGLVVYPGFLDLGTTLGQPPGVVRSRTGPGRAVNYTDNAMAQTPPDNRNGLTPEFEVATVLDLPAPVAEERRKLGFTDLLSAPAGAIATGQSALVSLSGLPRREAIVRAPVALHINVQVPFEPTPTPPTSTPRPDEAPARTRGQGRPGGRAYPQALMGAVAHLRQAMLDAAHDHEVRTYYEANGGPRPAFDPTLHALHAARTGMVAVWWEANTRDEIHRALDLAREFGTGAVIVGGREAGKVAERLKAEGVAVVLRMDFPEEPKAAEAKSSPPERAEPARVVADRAAKWREWVGTAAALEKAGVRFALASEGIARPETFHAQVRKAIAAGLSRGAAVAALTDRAAEIAGLGARLGTIEPGKLGHLVAFSAPYGEEAAQVRYILADGLKFDLNKPSADRKPDEDRASKKAEPKAEPAQAKPAEPAPPPPTQPRTGDDQPPRSPVADLSTEFDEDRKPKIKTGGNVLIRDATILTVTQGTIPKGGILVRDGKIAAVGPGLVAPDGVTVIDASGLVVMPGIIDAHSHMAIQGGVNEGSLSIVPEVRVKDVVTGDDPTIYRALAGGTTAARLLHGSANAIGGQDAVIKLRHGQPGRDLIVKTGPQGVKFALGENVTRDRSRFPNTRMGVESTIERAFEEAKAYRDRLLAHKYAREEDEDEIGPPPRRDLRLEALAGILDGTIKIHSHCYRSDEILMLLRLAARHGVRVQSLQHVLEGYKVAAEIAAHGAAAATFSDWWAYKVEAFDAIPQNAALLTRAGVRTSIKSDSEELVRHLNLEAAKMVKYGGVTEAEALAMITINPAREIGLDDRIGSIEVGKDADLAVFNAHPLDGYARCELTLIDGEVWFQRLDPGGRLAARPGEHATMPTPSAAAGTRGVEVNPNPERNYALVGGTLHPVSGPDIGNGTLVISAGKISAIGGPELTVPASAWTIDVRGLDIWPGLVDAGSQIGLSEIGSLSETQDYADSARFQPELRTSSALHPDSELIPVTRANGVLTTYVQPTGGTISGQGCVVNLDGWVPREMVLADRVALNVNVPPSIRTDLVPPRQRQGDTPDPRQKQRLDLLEAIKEQFRLALAYDKVATESKARGLAPPVPDPRLAALAPYAKGEKPVIFRAEGRNEILDALKIAEELKLKAIVSGGADAWKVADALKAAKVPVLIAGTLHLPTERTDPYDAPYANPARLHEAGVTFAIRSGGRGPETQATAGRNLPYEAAFAVAFGLPEADALRAVTLAPAQILGVADQVGSLEVGKRADLVLTAGHILQPTTEVKALFLGGKPLSPESRHTRLYAKYRRRLDEVKDGTAPLGLDPTPPLVAEPAPIEPAPRTVGPQ